MGFLRSRGRPLLIVPVALFAVAVGAAGALLAACGPFTDVAADSFCVFVREVFYLGITTGTSPTTYDPAANVSRLQMAAFLSRSVDGVLKRGSRRAAFNRFWIPQNATVLGVTTLSMSTARFPATDGEDVWVPTFSAVVRVRASDGGVLGSYTAPAPRAAIGAMGKVFVTGNTSLGALYEIDPRLPFAMLSPVAFPVAPYPDGLAFDGARIWTANNSGSVSILTPGAIPWAVTTVTTGFSMPMGALFEGTNVWVTDNTAGSLLKLGPDGTILQTVAVGSNPYHPIFDGTNIWVPNAASGTISVVRPGSGAVLATLTGNGLFVPYQAAFDGERVLVTNNLGASVSLWKASDLTPMGSYPTGASTSPFGVCSDGTNFWITVDVASASGRLLRF